LLLHSSPSETSLAPNYVSVEAFEEKFSDERKLSDGLEFRERTTADPLPPMSVECTCPSSGSV